MALDGIFLRGIVKELKDNLINGKVDKINQPEKDEVILFIRNNNRNLKLLLSSSPVYPKIHLTDINKENPMKAPMFCMVLRKYLKGGRIIDINQLGSDRIIKLTFTNTDELGFNSIYNLYVEIMGRHSNITLVRDRDNMIMDAIKHVTLDVNRVRTLLPMLEFVFPPKSEKLDPFSSDKNSLSYYIKNNNLEIDTNIYSNSFTGVSSLLSKELYLRYEDNIYNVFEFFKGLDDSYYLYKKNGKYKDFSPASLSFMKDYEEVVYNSPSKLISDFYLNKDKNDRLNSKSSNLQKIVNTNIDRCEKKIKILKNNLEKAKDKEIYRLQGELITANIYMLKEGMDKVNLTNYYNNEIVEVKLNPQKSPSHNAVAYYKKYNKLKTTEKMSLQQLKLAQEELTYLNSVLTNILNCDTYKEIDEIRKELMETGYIKFKKEKSKKETQTKPMHFKSSEGFDIYVGKNNIQNDYLTLKLSDKHDTWLHTKEIPGSHVIIKSRDVSRNTLEEAASLAAYYSKGRGSSKVPVDYTLVKYVKKPNGAKPGMVIYTTNQTIFVTPPESIKLERVD